MTEWTKRTFKDNLARIPIVGQQWIDDKGKARQVGTDTTTDAASIVDYAHHEIHGGSSYTCQDTTANLGGETGDHLQLLFTTADVAKRAHLFYHAYGAGACYITLREAPTGGGAGGSAATILNRRRDSAKTSSAIASVTKDATASTGGTLLIEHYVGAGAKDGGEVRGTNEWVLAPNTTYALRIYDTSAIAAWIDLSWYEHADR